MPSLADLRRRINISKSSTGHPIADEESLVTDSRCRISPTQAVESKLHSILRRAEERPSHNAR